MYRGRVCASMGQFPEAVSGWSVSISHGSCASERRDRGPPAASDRQPSRVERGPKPSSSRPSSPASLAKRRNKNQERGIARERVLRLEELAAAAFRSHRADRAARYGYLAGRIGRKYQMPLPASFRRRLCRSCGAYLVPGTTARVRVRSGIVVTTCLGCNRVMRVPFKPYSPAKGGEGAPPPRHSL